MRVWPLWPIIINWRSIALVESWGKKKKRRRETVVENERGKVRRDNQGNVNHQLR
jgi:hypothetical protein